MNNLDVQNIHAAIPFDSNSDHPQQVQRAQSHSSHSSTVSPSSLIHQTVEMPMPPMLNLSPTPSMINRTKKRRNTFLLKIGATLLLLLITVLIALPKIPNLYSNDEEDGSLKGKFMSSYKETGGSSDTRSDNNDLPNYAPVKLQEESTTSTSSHAGKVDNEEHAEVKSAAEALVCPQAVINFVINATDAKDECDGLRKAFDQTCAWSGEEPDGKRRRLLEDDSIPQTASWIRYLKQYTQSITPKITSKRRRRLDEKTLSSEVEDDNKYETTEPVTKSKEEKDKSSSHGTGMTHISPSLPTGTGHMTDKMAGDALGMNSELSDIAKAIEELGNVTHSHHSSDEEHSDSSTHAGSKDTKEGSGDEDSKDLTSAAVAVSAIINNPEVIEIQTCCRSILQVFHEECDNPEGEEYADRRLFVIVCVIGLCGLIKSLIRHFRIRWLPEAGGCILVGVVGGLFLKLLPNIDFAFSHDMFLRVMVPPIGTSKKMCSTLMNTKTI